MARPKQHRLATGIYVAISIAIVSQGGFARGVTGVCSSAMTDDPEAMALLDVLSELPRGHHTVSVAFSGQIDPNGRETSKRRNFAIF